MQCPFYLDVIVKQGILKPRAASAKANSLYVKMYLEINMSVIVAIGYYQQFVFKRT